MPQHWPPPNEYEETERRLTALRPWLRAVAAGLVAVLVAIGFYVLG